MQAGESCPPSWTPHLSSILNAGITCEEVCAARKPLKRNEAAGVDVIRAEFILNVVFCSPHV